MNAEERLEFVVMWNAELDQLESLDIAAWLRAYSQIHIRNNPGPAMKLVARIDDKIRTAADAIESPADTVIIARLIALIKQCELDIERFEAITRRLTETHGKLDGLMTSLSDALFRYEDLKLGRSTTEGGTK